MLQEQQEEFVENENHDVLSLANSQDETFDTDEDMKQEVKKTYVHFIFEFYDARRLINFSQQDHSSHYKLQLFQILERGQMHL